MPNEHTVARRYLLPTPGAFWEWRDNGEVATWRDGRTIAFHAEVVAVLQHLVPGGLPPLDTVMLVLAAARENWEALRFHGLVTSADYTTVVSTFDVDDSIEIVTELERIRRLFPLWRFDLQAKSVLCEAALEQITERLTPSDSAVVLEYARTTLTDLLDLVKRRDPDESQDRLPRIDAELVRGLRRIDADFELRLRTSLESLPRAAEVELPLGGRVRKLLESLRNDDELQGLAVLAQRLMAAVTMPRGVNRLDELQVGGVSDIANRGPLDRLLLSELAHDDLSLAVRIAMNEALYLRRESPPQTPPRNRTLLLETGVRSWGIPRVYATAVALALAATTERHVDLRAFRARGGSVEPVDLTTREGIVSHLSALEPSAHPGAALPAFEHELQAESNQVEPILVTTFDVLDDADFRRDLAAAKLDHWFFAGVDRTGRFELIEQSVHGRKLVRQARLDVDQLLGRQNDTSNSLYNVRLADDLPAIFFASPFPLLLPHSIDESQTWHVPGRGILTIAKDRRLMWWSRRKRGAFQLADHLPPGSLWWTSTETSEATAQAVVGFADPNGLHLLEIDFSAWSCNVVRLELERGVQSVCSVGRFLAAIYPRHICVVDQKQGTVVQKLERPSDLYWVRDRFFRTATPKPWYALASDGTTVHLEPVTGIDADRWPHLTTLFDRKGRDGPLGITERGDLFSTADGTVQRVRHGIKGAVRIDSILPDGSYVLLASDAKRHAKTGRHTVRIEVDTLKVADCFLPRGANYVPELSVYRRANNIRHRFREVFHDSQGRIGLVSRKDQLLVIDYDARLHRIMLREINDHMPLANKRWFRKLDLPEELGFSLSRTEWDDGSVAFLDTRGLLHLRSSDRSIPELSIVLANRELAGWTSDGRWWGSDYFVGDHPTSQSREIFDSIIVPFARKLACRPSH